MEHFARRAKWFGTERKKGMTRRPRRPTTQEHFNGASKGERQVQVGLKNETLDNSTEKRTDEEETKGKVVRMKLAVHAERRADNQDQGYAATFENQGQYPYALALRK